MFIIRLTKQFVLATLKKWENDKLYASAATNKEKSFKFSENYLRRRSLPVKIFGNGSTFEDIDNSLVCRFLPLSVNVSF